MEAVWSAGVPPAGQAGCTFVAGGRDARAPSRGKIILAVSLLFFVMLPLHSANETHPIFTDITRQSNLNFVHDPRIGGKYFFPEVMGAGCAFLDFDNDGDLDIYLVNGSTDRLFRQDPGGAFTDVTAASGLEDQDYGMGVAAGDIDNDGDLDLFVSNYGPDQLYRNNGDGTFSKITEQSGIKTSGWSTSAIFFDYDRDGLLDLYVARYVKLNPSVVCTDRAGRKDYCGPEGYDAEPDLLFHNNGNGTFTDVSKQAGIARFPRKGLGVVSADFDGDGYQDIYVANDREPNQLWINQHNGTFQDSGMAMGVAFNAMGQSEASMGVAAGDADQDGRPDLFVTNLRDETNTLYRNRGTLGFQDDSLPSGLGSLSLPFTGFGTGFFDFNNDGNLDVAVVNGRVTRGALLIHNSPLLFWDSYAEPNLLFENISDGHFRNMGIPAGSFTSSIENSRGLAFGDVDNDGDIDLLVSNCGGPARLYRNDLLPKGHWLLIRAVDPVLKRDALGAKITVVAGGKNLTRWVNPGYSYLSSNDPRSHFGLGAASAVDQIVVEWPDGTKETFPGTRVDQILTIRKGAGK